MLIYHEHWTESATMSTVHGSCSVMSASGVASLNSINTGCFCHHETSRFLQYALYII